MGGNFMPELCQTSDNMQQELMAAMKDFSVNDRDNELMAAIGEGDSFEWYAEGPELEKLLISHLSFPSEDESAGAQQPPEKEAADVSILVPRCGNKLSENLYDAGFKSITNLHISEAVIIEMLMRNRERPKMKWLVMDVSKMQIPNGTFDAIVDNGGLDSLMAAIPNSNLGRRYLYEVKRVLKAGGKYVCLTLAERSVLDLLFPMFRFGWKMKLYAIGQDASSRDPKLQSFMAVAEKMTSPEVHTISSLVEESNSNQAHDLYEVVQRENMIRDQYIDEAADMKYSLEDLRLGAIGNLSQLVPGRRVRLNLGRADGVLVDAKEDSGLKKEDSGLKTLLVPPDKPENHWLHTPEGQWLFVEISKASRVLMVLLDSSNSDLGMDDIQMDLSPLAHQLEPGYYVEGSQITKAADEISEREFVYQDSSVLTGLFDVEDVIYKDIAVDEADRGCTFRRLNFRRTQNLVQSEALLSIKESNIISTDVENVKEQRKSDSKSPRSPVSSGEVKVVHNHLVSRYHNGIVFGIRLISSNLKVSTSATSLVTGEVKTVVIGLGGGLLPMFMKNFLPSLKIEVVELDRKVLNVARDYFGFSDDESLKVHITDALKFVKEKADADENSSCKVDILVIDVHSSDASSPLTSPAADFVDESFLLTVKDSLSKQGLFIINLVSRSFYMRNAVYSRLRKVFDCILSVPIQEGINEVLFALKTIDSPIEDRLCEACNEFAKSLEGKKNRTKKRWIYQNRSSF